MYITQQMQDGNKPKWKDKRKYLPKNNSAVIEKLQSQSKGR